MLRSISGFVAVSLAILLRSRKQVCACFIGAPQQLSLPLRFARKSIRLASASEKAAANAAPNTRSENFAGLYSDSFDRRVRHKS
ncbi:hypothetical protein [Variibacter gotjawalensis]|uniref:hypothetical protein n=1 Tax=Variibacter gotjawalensis TaxID=1333996 RepID=UPI00102BE919|nr:hypothetical protein [Variibacter gotjawalensis]NIK48614.1 hypothetical protein [Variibacter gotjawalensis]